MSTEDQKAKRRAYMRKYMQNKRLQKYQEDDPVQENQFISEDTQQSGNELPLIIGVTLMAIAGILAFPIWLARRSI